MGLTAATHFFGMTVKFAIHGCKQDMDICCFLGDGDTHSFSVEE